MSIISDYFPDLSPVQSDQFDQLKDLYNYWNAQINVVSRKDIDEIYVRHVLHSLGIAKITGFLPGADILDVGTGGGFPGIPLAILFPEARFTLADSIGKKIKVVNEVAQALQLTNVMGLNERAENIPGPFDFVVSRAVTRMRPFHTWVKGKFKKEHAHAIQNGILYLKGGDLTEEMAESKLRYKSYDLSAFFKEDFFETKKVIYVPKQ